MKEFCIHAGTQAQFDFWVKWFLDKGVCWCSGSTELKSYFWKDNPVLYIGGCLSASPLSYAQQTNYTIYKATDIDGIMEREPKIKVCSYEVEFNEDKSIQVGCQHVPFETIKAIWEKVNQ